MISISLARRGFRSLSLAAAMTVLCTSALWAGEVKIYGDVTQTTTLRNSATSGAGAVSRFSSIRGGARIHGDVELTSDVGLHATMTTGRGRKATTSVATIHGDARLHKNKRRTVKVKEMINVDGCLSVASMGDAC